MVLVQKLTAFAWNVHDGRQNIDVSFSWFYGDSRLTMKSLLPWQKDRAILAPPNLLDYFGYIFFFPGFMTGPSTDFAEYKRWVTLTMFDVNVPDSKSATGVKRRRKIPHSGIPATIKLAEGTFWLIMTVVFGSRFDYHFALSDEFLKYSFLKRFFSVSRC
jgi:lysophospholipid acyltransferase